MHILLVLYAISGFCTLALETIWIRALALRIGNTTVSATLVIAVFFLAAAAGNLWGSRWARTARRPVRVYGACEMSAGVLALLGYLLIDPLSTLLHAGGHFLITLVIVGPAAFAAGTSFPALSEAYIPRTDRRTADGGGIYSRTCLARRWAYSVGACCCPCSWGTWRPFPFWRCCRPVPAAWPGASRRPRFRRRDGARRRPRHRSCRPSPRPWVSA